MSLDKYKEVTYLCALASMLNSMKKKADKIASLLTLSVVGHDL